ncbi:actin, cytoplasmic 2-like protein [Obelidium mucronatum]|nr:actin, cytoplasmic 2-like protein [Obelidium mucronatum]
MPAHVYYVNVNREGVPRIGFKAPRLNYHHAFYSPVYKGSVERWGDLGLLWNNLLQEELQITLDDIPVLLSEGPMRDKATREGIISVMFERHNVSSCYLENHAVLSLYAAGLKSGLVLDIGETASHVVPVYEGHSISHAVQQSDVCGESITDKLFARLKDQPLQNAYVKGAYRMGELSDWKEMVCYVALDYDKELEALASDSPLHYTLPDGQMLNLGGNSKENPRFTPPEFLFQPYSYWERAQKLEGIHFTVLKAINECDVDLHPCMYGNFVLAGGTTNFRGFPERLEKELIQLAPVNASLNFVTPPTKKYAAWIGGSILASLSTFEAMAIQRAEYEECGPSIVHRKCI